MPHTVIGTQKALDNGVPAIGAVVVGMFAGVTGGVIVSLLQQERPMVITPSAPYAVLALVGLLLYLALLPVNAAVAAVTCVGFVVVARLVTLRRGVRTSPIAKERETVGDGESET